MDKLDTVLSGGLGAQEAVIGSMLRDDQCVPLALSRMTPEDFVDGTCRATFTAIRKLAAEGRPVDPVTVVDAMQGGERYAGWVKRVMIDTPSAANVEAYIPIAQKAARAYRIRALAGQVLEQADLDDMDPLVRRMFSILSATERMATVTGPELAKECLERLRSKEKPKYLPWGLPTADRNVYAELGDMILLGGRASSGKTLLSILMAMAQAKAGYKVGYYSLETQPRKMGDRMLSALGKVPLERIKTKNITEREWPGIVEGANLMANVCPFDIIQASNYTVADIVSHAIGHGYQIIYVDYVQLIRAPGKRELSDYSRVTAVSQALKTFAQSTSTAVVALAQLSRPDKSEKAVAPTMYSFKDSGQLEQDADVAFLLWASQSNDNGSNRMFKIAKNKEGHRPAAVELEFRGDIQTMVEMEQDLSRLMAAEASAQGRAIKKANRARAYMRNQAQFQELPDGEEDNPFGED